MTDDSQMKTYASVHGRLNWKRDEARRVGADGPRCRVRANCGKSTLCRVLLAYAVRTGYAPTLSSSMRPGVAERAWHRGRSCACRARSHPTAA